MENYEINILKRDGNWKRINPNPLSLDDQETKNITQEYAKNLENKNSNDDFIEYINEINIIINKLETLETEKSILKSQLKIYEQKFIGKKNITEDRILSMNKEKEMLDKTISIIKKLKSF